MSIMGNDIKGRSDTNCSGFTSNYTYIYYICLFIYSGKVELYGGLFPVYDVRSDIMNPTEVLDVLLNTDCSSDVICH